MKKAWIVAAGLGLCQAAQAAEAIHFVWESADYGKPGFRTGQRVESRVTPGVGTCVLVSGGAPRAQIVLAADPTRAAQVAAAELRYYVEKITGAKLAIVTDSVRPRNVPRVLVGESALTRTLGLSSQDFEEQAYLIRSYGDMLVLMGHDEQEFGLIDYEGTGLWPEFSSYYEWKQNPECSKKIGTVYAVDEFLQRHAGVRWFMPGPMGEVCPRRETLSVANLDARLRPWSDYRWYGPENFRDYFNYVGSGKPDVSYPQAHGQAGWRDINLWMMRMKVFGTEAYGANHSLVGSWFKERVTPEQWEQIKAKGYGEDPHQLCLTGEALADILVQDARDYMAGKTNYERSCGRYMPVMAHDYSGQWCMCPACRAVLKDVAGPGSYGFWNDRASDYMWGLVDRVARRLKTEAPGLWVSCCAYAGYTFPPSMALSDNVASTFCRVLVDGFKHPDYKPLYRQWLTQWAGRVSRLYLWEYFDHVQGNGTEAFFPGIFLGAIEEDMRFLRSIGLKGLFNELNSLRSCVPNFAQDHLNLYVWLKLASQDRNEDVAAADLFADYCRAFYGPAEAPMAEFFSLAEAQFTNPAHWQLSGEQVMADWETICPPAVLERFDGHLAKAEALAAEDPYATRVRLIREAVYGMMAKNGAKHQDFLRNRKRLEVTKLPPGQEPFSTDRHPMGEFLTITGEPTSPKTEAWMDYDATNLYVRVTCTEENMGSLVRTIAPSTNRNEVAGIFGDDSVEVFIDVGREQSGHYFQLVGNPNAALWEAEWNRPEPPNKEYRSGAAVAVREEQHSWTLDFAIPIRSLKQGGAIQAGEEWGLNLCRNRRRKDDLVQYRCWSPTCASFHETKRFGIVRFP